ncbi:tail fiber domain-containing protein [Flavilitoribacter nigricans]|uniref:Peptidase S74 domain-containing protein n=1 Tax=Flavilitoribacter nigricans (strain ATCC 23147 / DSM 23189 / NBRC 102662 / NCIMB 1420 / SS-2) TaxID=1122177 RepID=A0A2D0N9C8_FLAN2|nr:tail fiber domain-containing protein [Flavilitoribacter nigricans]PHN05124.1 hypothetical protein CRP01_19070 [Flavilitoribacter nigricans DSM 23189 = NBRC 102662]
MLRLILRLSLGIMLYSGITASAQVVLKPTQIGINENNPAQNVSLHIRDNFESIRLDGSSPFISFYNGTDYRGYLYMTGDQMYLYNRKNGSIFFGANNAAKMTISNLGDVGIGTTTPNVKLQVREGTVGVGNFNANTIAAFEKSSGNGYLTVLTGSNTESGLLFGDESSGQRGGIVYNNASTADGLQLRTNGNFTRMVIDNVGDVGIGTTNPIRPLDVKSRNGGDEYGIRMERAGSAVSWEMSLFQGEFNFFYNGGITPVAVIATNGTYSGSDRRLKKNIRPYKKVLPLLPALHISTFEYTADQEAKPSLGLIAQDVAKVYPEIVRLAPNRAGEMYLSLDYSKTGVLALKALQELQEERAAEALEKEKLQAEVQALQSENRELRKRLSDIEAAIARLEKATGPNTQEVLLEGADAASGTQPLLHQNEPNPFTGLTRIRYFIPERVEKALIQIAGPDGKVLKRIPIREKGEGLLNVETRSLSTGTYVYSLILDGEVFESRRMVLGGR